MGHWVLVIVARIIVMIVYFVIIIGAVGGLDCVHLMHPTLHGASAIIAAGSRDSMVYLWRRRSEDMEGVASGRSMRSFTGTTLTGHKV